MENVVHEPMKSLGVGDPPIGARPRAAAGVGGSKARGRSRRSRRRVALAAVAVTAVSAGAMAAAASASAAGTVGPNEWGYELITPAGDGVENILGLGVTDDMRTAAVGTYSEPIPGLRADGRNLMYVAGVTRGGAPWDMGRWDSAEIGVGGANKQMVWAQDSSLFWIHPGTLPVAQWVDSGGKPLPESPQGLPAGLSGHFAGNTDYTAIATRVTNAGNPRSVYLSRRGEPAVLASVREDGSLLNTTTLGRATANLSLAQNVVSADGLSVIFATNDPLPGDNDGTAQDVVRRDLTPGAERTIVVSDATPGAGTDTASKADFVWASADHDAIVFETPEKLVPDDTDSSSDLYVRLGGGSGALVMVSKGEMFGGVRLGNAGSQGINWVTSSPDEKYFYLFSREPLTATAAAAGATNGLYQYSVDQDRLQLVASGLTVNELVNKQGLGTTFARDPMVRAFDGGIFFSVRTALDGAPAGSTRKLYRWTPASGIEWVSRPAPGAPSTVASEIWLGAKSATDFNDHPDLDNFDAGRAISDDGSVAFFTTNASLVAEDTDGGYNDVYRWKQGEGLSLVSLPGRAPYESTYQNNSADGSLVYINTTERYLDEDTDPGAADIYLAILGGGSPPTDGTTIRAATECSGDACQGPATDSGGRAGIGSVGFAGAGNLLAAPEVRRVAVSVAKVKPVQGSKVTLRVKVSERGRVRVSGSGLAQTSKSVKKAGTYRVSVKLSSRAQQTLRRKHRVTVRATVRLTPQKGRSVVKRVSVTFKQSTAKKATSKKGGR